MKTIQITLDNFEEGLITYGETWNESAEDIIEVPAIQHYTITDADGYTEQRKIHGNTTANEHDLYLDLIHHTDQIIFDNWFEDNWTKTFADVGLDNPTVWDYEDEEYWEVESIDDFINNCKYNKTLYYKVFGELVSIAKKEYEVVIYQDGEELWRSC